MEHVTDESKCQLENRLLQAIRCLKSQNRIHEQQELVNQLKIEVRSYRKISKYTSTPLKTVHQWCSEPKERLHKGTKKSKSSQRGIS